METATNPETGEKIYFSERSGEWLPLETATNSETGERVGLIDGEWRPLAPTSAGAAPSSSAGSLLGNFGEGFNEGLAGILGFPVDAVNNLPRVLNILPGEQGIGPMSDYPVGGSAMFRDALEGIGSLGNFEADTRGERIIRRTGQELGAAAVPAAGAIAAAPRLAQAGANTLRGSFFGPIANAPGRASLGETAAAAGAGVGAGIAREAAPGSMSAEMAGQIIGGLSPTVFANLPASLATRAANRAVQTLSPAAQERAGRQAIGDYLGNEFTGMGPRLTEAQRLRQEMPGFNPTIGEATGRRSLVRAQTDLESRASGGALEDLVRRRDATERAVSDFAARRAPEGVSSPEYVVDTASGRVEGVRGAIASDIQALGGERGGVASQLPQADRAAAGAAIRERLNAVRDQRREQMTALANELGINDLDVSVDFRNAAEDIANDFAPASRFEDMSNYPRVLSQIAEAADGEVTLADLKALRERVSDDLIDAMGAANPSRRQIRILSQLKARVDQVFDDIAAEAAPGVAENLRQFRAAYFDQYIRPFEQGAAYRVRNRGGTGFYQTPDERVADAFFSPDAPSNARQFTEILGGDDQAMAAMEAVVLDSLRRSAVTDGVIDPAKYQRWLDRHASVLDQLPPSVRARVSSIQRADDAVLGRVAELGSRERAIGEARLVRQLDGYRRQSLTAEQVIGNALRDERNMRDLVATLDGDPEAMAALRRVVWDQASTGSASDISRFLTDNRETLSHVLTDQHMSDLQDIALARGMLENAPRPSGSAELPRVGSDVERLIGQGIPQLSSRIFAFKSGRMQRGYLVVDTVLRGLRGRAQVAADDALRGALYDPEVARTLAEAIDTAQLTPEKARRLQTLLIRLGVVGVSGDQEERPRLQLAPQRAPGVFGDLPALLGLPAGQ